MPYLFVKLESNEPEHHPDSNPLKNTLSAKCRHREDKNIGV